MDEADLQLLADNLQWQRLLDAYLEMAAEQQAVPGETGPRWVGRVISMKDVTPEELSAIHGHLIALGWLHFQLEDGQNGLSYRVSSDGRRILKRLEFWQSGAADQTVNGTDLDDLPADDAMAA